MEKRVENETSGRVVWTNFKMFGNVVKHGLECLICLLRRIYKIHVLRRKWGNKIAKI